MNQINERVDVGIVNDIPKWIRWRGRIHKIEKIGFHHTYREGEILIHIFSVTTPTLFLRLKFDSAFLSWTLEGVSDVI